MALLHSIHELSGWLGISAEVLHVNHLVRGREAQADADLVRKTAENLGLVFHYKEIEPVARKPRGVTTEEYFRIERHSKIRAVAEETGISHILLGHSADDMAETFLMHMLRGAGLRGLSFSPRQDVNGLVFLRPLWKTSREKILKYLAHHGIAYAEDASNYSLDFTRNRIRHSLIPAIEKDFNPSIRETLRRTADVLSMSEEYLRETALRRLRHFQRATRDVRRIPLRAFRKLEPILKIEVAREWLDQVPKARGRLTHNQTLAILKFVESHRNHLQVMPSCSIVKTEDLLTLVVSGDKTTSRSREGRGVDELAFDELARHYLEQSGATPLCKIDAPIELSAESLRDENWLRFKMLDGSSVRVLPRLADFQTLPLGDGNDSEWAELKPPVYLRNRRPGDRISDSVRLKSVLINDKVPYFVRDFLLLIADAKGNVLHVVGMERVNARIERPAITTDFDILR